MPSPLRSCPWFLTLAVAWGGVVGMCGAESPQAQRPNIVVILVDDMGFSDLGCYGSEIPTPHLDALATGGLQFTQFYNAARCCPTRASLLTGRYSHQVGIGHMIEDRQLPGYRGRLHDHCITLPEAMQRAGYFTAMTGKWHVGQEHGVTPWGRGFGRSLNAAAGGFYFPSSERAQLFLNGEQLQRGDPRLTPDWYSTDLWTTWGVKFIDEALRANQPFFLYLAHNAPHFPLQAPAETIAEFRGKYLSGWDQLSAERHTRQKDLGIMLPHWVKAERPDTVPAWNRQSRRERDRFDHMMATYAACVHRIDQAVGDLVTALRERGVLDQTLILFMSDNGGNAESGPNGRTKGSNPSQAASGWWCGASWAYLQNTPFRRSKRFTHEGGIASPLIVHWPAGIPVVGERRHQPAHVVDIMATCLDVGGATLPATFANKPVEPMEGRSLVPALANEPIDREALYWEHEGHAAVRMEDWKLVRTGIQGAWELYNLAEDRTEQRDLAGEHPDRVGVLTAKWNAWAQRAHVQPSPLDRLPATP